MCEPCDCPCAVFTPAFKIQMRLACDGIEKASEAYRDIVSQQMADQFEACVGDVLAAQLHDGACGGPSLVSCATDVSGCACVGPAQAYGHLAATKGTVLHIPAIAVGAYVRDGLLTFVNGRYQGPAGERVIVSAGYDNVGPGGLVAPAGCAWVYISRAVDWCLSEIKNVFPTYEEALDTATNTWEPCWEAYGMVRVSCCGVYAALVDVTDCCPCDPKTVTTCAECEEPVVEPVAPEGEPVVEAVGGLIGRGELILAGEGDRSLESLPAKVTDQDVTVTVVAVDESEGDGGLVVEGDSAVASVSEEGEPFVPLAPLAAEFAELEPLPLNPDDHIAAALSVVDLENEPSTTSSEPSEPEAKPAAKKPAKRSRKAKKKTSKKTDTEGSN